MMPLCMMYASKFIFGEEYEILLKTVSVFSDRDAIGCEVCRIPTYCG